MKTSSGYPPKKAEHEKLNDERGASPCQSAAAETEPNREKPNQEGYGDASVFYPRKSVPKHLELETMARREFRTYLDGLNHHGSDQRDCCSKESN